MIVLKKLNIKSNISLNYLKWMNDPDVQKFTEQRFKRHSLKDIKNFVQSKNSSKDEFLFGIFIKKNFLFHIGNIKLGPINFIHKTAFISYFIGEKSSWGKSYGSKAISEIIQIAKKKKLKKLKAGVYEQNIASQKVLKKNGFKIEGRFKYEKVYNGRRYSYFEYGKILK